MTEDIIAILERPTCSVAELGQILGLSKNPTYDAVRRGDVQAIRSRRAFVQRSCRRGRAMRGYPPCFNEWPLEKRNDYFAKEARDYRAKERQATNGEDKYLEAGRGETSPGSGDGLDLEIARLAKLSTADYERERKSIAKRLDIRATILDKLVAAARPADESAGQGRPLAFPEPEPWPTPVDGVALVIELTAAIRKYVVLTENAALTAALWALHTYCFDAFPCTPRLAVTAPEKRCGKTTLLDVMAVLVVKALASSNISPASLFRTVELAGPTLLIDEADTFLGEDEELRGILNAGHRAGGQVIRTVGDDFEPRAFSTHCPVAIAQIGKLPDTLADRSIHISMKRRAPGEKVARLRIGRTPELFELARKAARWVADNANAIRECDPVIPDAIFNRAADNWEPLLAIAEVAGGDIPEWARKAALAACGADEELSPREALLADIREVFAENGGDRMSSADLVAALVAMADKPWCECNHGKPLTQNGLARRLKGFGLKPSNIKIGGQVPKGYHAADFQDAFACYLPETGPQSATAATGSKIKDLGEKQTATCRSGVAVQNSSNILNSLEVAAVAVQNPVSGVRAQSSGNVPDEKAANPRIGRVEI